MSLLLLTSNRHKEWVLELGLEGITVMMIAIFFLGPASLMFLDRSFPEYQLLSTAILEEDQCHCPMALGEIFESSQPHFHLQH